MINFAENLNKMIAAGLGGETEAPRTEVAVGHRVQYMDASGPVASFETNIVAPLKKLLVNMLPIQAGSGDPSPDNLRPISGRDSVNIWNAPTHDTTLPPTVTVQLGQTVYGGNVEIISGQGQITKALRTFNELSAYSWQRLASNGAFYMNREIALPNVIYPITFPYEDKLPISSVYKYSVSGRQPDFSMRVSDALYIIDSRFQTVSEFQAALAQMEGGIVYKLAEPQAFILTPASLSTLKGDNNVWSDAGDVDVTYIYYEETEGY